MRDLIGQFQWLVRGRVTELTSLCFFHRQPTRGHSSCWPFISFLSLFQVMLANSQLPESQLVMMPNYEVFVPLLYLLWLLMSWSGIIASSCIVMSFPLCLSTKSCRYVVCPSKFKIVGCEDPVIISGGCISKVCCKGVHSLMPDLGCFGW